MDNKITGDCKIFTFFIICISLYSAMPPVSGKCCSSFHFSEHDISVVGKNYDWMVKSGLIIINKRGVNKTAFFRYDENAENPATWISKYGSITFCQYGIEIPAGGMNEMGLVVSSQAMPSTKYPELADRRSIERRQWLQYQLDNYATVSEVILHFNKIQVRPDSFGSHYFIADAKGKNAVIEFIDGKAKIYIARSLPYPVLTNSEYRKCSRYVKKTPPKVDPHQSIERFITAATELLNKKREYAADPIGAAFKLLNTISQDDFTKWSIVYDAANLQVFYHSLGNKDIRKISLMEFDLNCNTPVQYLEIENDLAGDVTDRFVNYHVGEVFGIVYSSFEQSPFIQHIDPAQVLHRVTHAGRYTCAAKAAIQSEPPGVLEGEAAVAKVINDWETYWNSREVEKLMALIHEESQIMYGWRQLATKQEYAYIVEQRMREVGSFKFKDIKTNMTENQATVKAKLSIGWGDFPCTFVLRISNGHWLVTSFKYKL